MSSYAMKALLIIIFLTSLPACSFIVGELPNGPGYITRQRATNIASNYIASNNLPWGEPMRVQFINNTFLFHYDTPNEESALIGGRALYVNIETGTVSFPPRL